MKWKGKSEKMKVEVTEVEIRSLKIEPGSRSGRWKREVGVGSGSREWKRK
jgi:hypothetical protein